MDRRLVLIATGLALAVTPRGALAQRQAPAERGIGTGWQSMNRDLVLIGPAADPARVFGLRDAAEALRRIASVGATFVSGGHGSGTHEAEHRLWRAARVDPAAGRGRWYREVAQGTGPALEAAVALDAYALADRSAWLALRERRNLRIVVEGDSRFGG
jgi:tungstate transport system substrate-binding protein